MGVKGLLWWCIFFGPFLFFVFGMGVKWAVVEDVGVLLPAMSPSCRRLISSRRVRFCGSFHVVDVLSPAALRVRPVMTTIVYCEPERFYGTG